MSRPAHRRSPETAAIIAIDKDRRSTAQKARDRKLRGQAYDAAQKRLQSLPEEELERHCDGELDAIRDVLTARIGAASASSALAARAEQAIISGSNARARADQLFGGGVG